MIESMFRGIARVEAAAGAMSIQRLQASERPKGERGRGRREREGESSRALSGLKRRHDRPPRAFPGADCA